MAITTGRVAAPWPAGEEATAESSNNGGGDRKLLTKAAHHQIFGTQRTGKGRGASSSSPRPAAVICILIFAIKTLGVAGNAIRNIDHQIINDADSDKSSSSFIGDLSIPRPQNQDQQQLSPTLHPSSTAAEQQLNQNHNGRSATDANGTTTMTLGGAGGGGPLSSSSILGRAATYSYFYIGRKLLYVPLFFLVYWSFYNMYLLGQTIANRHVSSKIIDCVPGKYNIGIFFFTVTTAPTLARGPIPEEGEKKTRGIFGKCGAVLWRI